GGLAATVRLGLNHEQQHQELILTDLKHAWSANPLHPVYREALPDDGRRVSQRWHEFPAGQVEIGHDGVGFAFDNQGPRHAEWLHPFQIAGRLVTNAEYLAFMHDSGYERPEFWLSDGWATRQTRGWNAPLYWENHDGDWFVVTLAGLRPLALEEP